MRKIVLCFFTFLYSYLFDAQNTDFDRGLKVGEIIVNGLSVLKGGKSNFNNSNTATKSKFCVKNKMQEKIQFLLVGKTKKDDEEIDIKKELVIPKDGKECLFQLEKQIWNYEIILTAKKETYKKGELELDDEITLTVSE